MTRLGYRLRVAMSPSAAPSGILVVGCRRNPESARYQDEPLSMDVRALGSALLVCAAITVASLATGTHWKPLAAPPAGWCLPNQTPSFSFGFADLAHGLGDVMGQPVECEHGAGSEGDTAQETTTGLAQYRWCTNTSTFTRGPEHWSLVPTGMVRWIDGEQPPETPVIRAPDLREPCPPT